MNCYKCYDTENLTIKSQRKSTGYKLYICKECRNSQARERISRQATFPHRYRATDSSLELLRQHQESMKRIHLKLAAGGYEG